MASASGCCGAAAAIDTTSATEKRHERGEGARLTAPQGSSRAAAGAPRELRRDREEEDAEQPAQHVLRQRRRDLDADLDADDRRDADDERRPHPQVAVARLAPACRRRRSARSRAATWRRPRPGRGRARRAAARRGCRRRRRRGRTSRRRRGRGTTARMIVDVLIRRAARRRPRRGARERERQRPAGDPSAGPTAPISAPPIAGTPTSSGVGDVDLAAQRVERDTGERGDHDRTERGRGRLPGAEGRDEDQQRHDHDAAADAEQRAEDACDEADEDEARTGRPIVPREGAGGSRERRARWARGGAAPPRAGRLRRRRGRARRGSRSSLLRTRKIETSDADARIAAPAQKACGTRPSAAAGSGRAVGDDRGRRRGSRSSRGSRSRPRRRSAATC